ncbi:hypothetical protein ACFLW8_04570 [Chloroflexota bacterium]
MFETLTDINLASPVLKGILTAAEILLTGFALYWLWEIGIKLFGLLGKRNVKSAQARPETTITHIPRASIKRKSIAGVGSESGSTTDF